MSDLEIVAHLFSVNINIYKYLCDFTFKPYVKKYLLILFTGFYTLLPVFRLATVFYNNFRGKTNKQNYRSLRQIQTYVVWSVWVNARAQHCVALGKIIQKHGQQVLNDDSVRINTGK